MDEAANDQNVATASSKAPHFLHSATCKLAEANSATRGLIAFEVMPRYYFHIYDGNGLDRDDAGTDLVNIHDVRTEAMSLARDLCYLWNDLPPGALNNMAIEVADETGQTVLVLPFSAAMDK